MALQNAAQFYSYFAVIAAACNTFASFNASTVAAAASHKKCGCGTFSISHAVRPNAKNSHDTEATTTTKATTTTRTTSNQVEAPQNAVRVCGAATCSKAMPFFCARSLCGAPLTYFSIFGFLFFDCNCDTCSSNS